MLFRLLIGFLALPVLLALLVSPSALADGTNVALQDATDGANISGMKMIVTPDEVKSGRVTFHVTNESKGLLHEMIVIRQPASNAGLPSDAGQRRVVETNVADLGEVSDLAAGKSGSLTVNLSPGKYLLICNQPGHYKAGMWAKLTVRP